MLTSRTAMEHIYLNFHTPTGQKKGSLQYFGLENSVDYTVHGVAKSRIQLSDFHFQPHWASYWIPYGTAHV